MEILMKILLRWWLFFSNRLEYQAKKNKKFLSKRSGYKGSRKEDQKGCFNCKKPRHFISDCPVLQKEKSKDKSKKSTFKSNKIKKQIKQSLMATWEDLYSESESDKDDADEPESNSEEELQNFRSWTWSWTRIRFRRRKWEMPKSKEKSKIINENLILSASTRDNFINGMKLTKSILVPSVIFVGDYMTILFLSYLKFWMFD